MPGTSTRTDESAGPRTDEEHHDAGAGRPVTVVYGSVAAVVLVAALVVAGPSHLLDYVIRGIPLGCVFALMAVGIVLAYKTSGVLNLAFAAQAFVSAAIFYDLRARHEWPTWAAFAVAVLIVAPLLGLLLDVALFRHLRSAPPIARLVTSIGLLVAIPQLTRIWFGKGATFNPPSVFPDPLHVNRYGDYALDNNQLGTIVVTVATVAALTAMFRYTSLGLMMRSVVESPRLAQLHGVDADRISAGAWALSSLMAGLAGVLLAPLYAQVLDTNFFILLVAALAAAVFGRLSSIPLTFLGALLLAVAMQFLGGELPQGSIVTQNLRPALPFVVLIVLLVAWPGLAGTREASDPLAGVDPPPPAPLAGVRPPWLTWLTRGLGVVVPLGIIVWTVTAASDATVNRVSIAVVLAIAFLSITVITGMGGTVSLCQTTFAAIGAFTTAQLVNEQNLDVMTAVLIGMLLAAVVGAIVALPALRLRGMYLTLVTLAFAIAFETVAVAQPWVSGGTQTLRVPRPVLGPFDMGDDKNFFLFLVVCLAISCVVVLLLRGGTTGRFLDALRGSEVAAASIGIDARRMTFTAFFVSAALAGFAGGLLVTQTGTAGSSAYNGNFAFFFGLVWVSLVVPLGARSAQAAIFGAVAFVFFPELLKNLDIDPAWATVLFGLSALTYARHPEGIIEANGNRFARLLARSSSPGPDGAPPPASDTPATVGPVGGAA